MYATLFLHAAAGLPPGHSLDGDERCEKQADQAKAPILAGGQSWRLATAGGDNNVRIWMIHPNIPSPSAMAASSGATPHPPRTEYVATLARHTGAVNVVRFSPRGDMLASAGDDGTVLFWVRQDPSRQSFGESHFATATESDGMLDKESWRVRLMTRATPLELYDLAWSKDSDYVAVGGTDFAVRLIQVSNGSIIREISDHHHYVQGISWDPLQMYLATQSSDRCMHVYQLLFKDKGKLQLDTQLKSKHTRVGMVARTVPEALKAERNDKNENEPAPCLTSPGLLPSIQAPEPTPVAPAQGDAEAQKMYGDDRCTSFFRRLDFSPDGALLASPTGQFSSKDQDKPSTSHAVYMYGRANLEQNNAPIAVLPGHKTATVVVRFSPILYRLRPTSQNVTVPAPAQVTADARNVPVNANGPVPTSVIGLPYRMIYAVATQESVWIYDTQQAGPLCCFSNLHYASFTDFAWSPDGQSLVMSSSDGYCSVAVFDYHELGRPYLYSKQPSLYHVPSRTPDLGATIPSAPAPELAQRTSTEPLSKPETNAPPSSEPPSAASASEPKKKRRVALTYEGPLSSTM